MATRDLSTLTDRLAATIRVVPDFPSPGIMFQDVTPVLANADLLRETIAVLAEPWAGAGVTHVAAIALALGAGFIPIRKPGKLPFERAGQDYALEYGTGRLEVHVDACPASARVLIVDDVLATGGTAKAACELIEAVGGTVVGCAFVLALLALKGERLLGRRDVRVLVPIGG